MMIISAFLQRQITIGPACSLFASGGQPDGEFSVIALAAVIFIVGLLFGSSFSDIGCAMDTSLAVKFLSACSGTMRTVADVALSPSGNPAAYACP